MTVDFTNPAFWLSVGQIILIDILLGGDNAVVIALACRRLPPALRNKGIVWGVVGAVVARIVLIAFALQLLALPFLKIVGALLLFWIGVKLMLPEDEDEHGKLDGGTTLWSAVRTVIIADAVMSLDNVIAVAAAAKGHLGLVVFGILVSVPIIVWGSKFVLALIDRFPLVITLGAGLLGWIGGGMLLGDAVLVPYHDGWPGWLHTVAAAAGALLGVGLGTLLASRKRSAARGNEATVPVASAGRRWLVPVDADTPFDAVAEHLAQERQRDAQLGIVLLNVQMPLESGHARMFVTPEELQAYHREEAAKALQPMQAALAQRGLAGANARHVVGHVVPTILATADEEGVERIVVARHRRADLVERVLGSIAEDVCEAAKVPVTVLK
jgi:YjbE family integral membrane protein